jgi:hypothetical protein
MQIQYKQLSSLIVKIKKTLAVDLENRPAQRSLPELEPASEATLRDRLASSKRPRFRKYLLQRIYPSRIQLL